MLSLDVAGVRWAQVLRVDGRFVGWCGGVSIGLNVTEVRVKLGVGVGVGVNWVVVERRAIRDLRPLFEPAGDCSSPGCGWVKVLPW